MTVGAFRVSGNGRLTLPSPPQVLSDQRFVAAYIANPEAKLAYQRLNTPEEQIRFIKTAAYNYLDTLPVIVVGGVEYKILHFDSTPIVWNNRRNDMSYSRMRIQFSEDGDGNNDVVLNRPLLDFTLPDGTWRPWDLHANCLKKNDSWMRDSNDPRLLRRSQAVIGRCETKGGCKLDV